MEDDIGVYSIVVLIYIFKWYLVVIKILMCGIAELSSPVGCDFHHFG